MKEVNELNVVHDDNLILFLENLGVFDDIKGERKKCKFCKEVVNLENLHSIFPESNDIKIVCDHPGCVKALAEYISDKKYG